MNCFNPLQLELELAPNFYERRNRFAPETVRKNGVVPRFLPVNWHITKETYDKK